MTSLDDVLAASTALLDELNQVVDSVQDPWEQCQVDWIWFRMHSVVVLLRDRGGGPAAAVLARGLLEQAAYWDWALATGVGSDWVTRQTAFELNRLMQLADSIDDRVWTGWLLPPGTSVNTTSADGIPRSAADAVKRLGTGLDDPCIEPLRFRGLYSVYRLLEVLSHGGIAAAYVLKPGGGAEMSEPLAAATAHVANAGGAAAAIAQLNLSRDKRARLAELELQVAKKASNIHRLHLGNTTDLRSPSKSGGITPLALSSEIELMPQTPRSLSEKTESYMECANNLAQIAVNRVRTNDVGASLTWPVFQMAWAQLVVLRGVVEESLGKALLPFAARPLFEEGARWAWMRSELASGRAPGVGLSSIVDDSRRRVDKIRDSLAGDNVPRDHIDHLLGPATQIPEGTPTPEKLPDLRDILSKAYPSVGGTESAYPIYSLLSQFVHPAQTAVLHLQPDRFSSISTPMYAVAVEAACRGFSSTAISTLAICCEGNEEMDKACEQLTKATTDVTLEANELHFVG